MYFGIVMPTRDSLDIHYYYLEITVSLLTCVVIYLFIIIIISVTVALECCHVHYLLLIPQCHAVGKDR